MPRPESILPARIEQAEAYLQTCVASTTFDVLAARHDVDLPAPSEGVGERLSAIAAMSGRMWDFRGMLGGVERQDMKPEQLAETIPGFAGITEQGSEAWDAVMTAADSWHMIKTTLPEVGEKPAARIALGAFGLSALHRVQFVMGTKLTKKPANGVPLPEAAPREGEVSAFRYGEGLVVALGTHRKLNEKAGEPALAALYAPGAKTEFDLMEGAVRREIRGRKVRQYTYELDGVGYPMAGGEKGRMVVHEVDGGNMVVKSLYAPQPVTTELGRAQTGHTYDLLRTALSDEIRAGDRVVIGTNALYVPFQGDAAQTGLFLPAGWKPELSGFSADEVGLKRKAVTLPPEFHSHVRHLQGLQEAIAVAWQST